MSRRRGRRAPSGPHRVVALCLPQVVAFDLAAPAEVFCSEAARRDGRALYEFSVCAPEAGSVVSTTGFEIGGCAGLEALERAETVVVPAYSAVLDPLPGAVVEGLRGAAARGARMVSVCGGAFALAHAGILDGRRATTHWAYADELAARFPAVRVEPQALYIDEGDVLTSAGLSAGIDLCLYLVRRDHGAAVGDWVARAMVAAPHRDGGQAQFIRRPRVADEGTLEATRRWAIERLAEPLTVEAMAAHAGVSPRTFARRFRDETGTTPLQWLLAQRVHEAQRLLEKTDLPIEHVAWRAGFGTATSLREHFRRSTATTPTAYRRSFRPLADAMA